MLSTKTWAHNNLYSSCSLPLFLKTQSELGLSTKTRFCVLPKDYNEYIYVYLYLQRG